MKKVERVLFKLLIIQLFCLLFSQALLRVEAISPYISKIPQYEGVTKENITKIVETFDQ
ncbi:MULTISPECIES: YpfB family protein [Priestia]|jgi:hypothetical protein|uniref:Uncharacterized protein n=1 Tax=Priestia endophytica DSM 13796 TaxID=1121089 RepID=A0A1I5VZB5_9BACI|nr:MULTISPECIES: YpfB family protein [Priestia]MCM3539432.1 YpfB family protein [Priestia endophytica]MCY8232765.1 YpfB family protein [Priestia endophytica]MDT3764230.1 YpfB family protein [Priestia filamentosa]MED3725152.1 YpfB family protein [Priestia filamentosa]UOE61588.1 YpfB family protein [Priestia filamentosa]